MNLFQSPRFVCTPISFDTRQHLYQANKTGPGKSQSPAGNNAFRSGRTGGSLQTFNMAFSPLATERSMLITKPVAFQLP